MQLYENVWRSYLLSNATLRYFNDMGDRYRAAAKTLEVMSMLLSSGAAATWIYSHADHAVVMAIASAVCSALQAVFRLEETSAACALAAKHWTGRYQAWEALWTRARDNITTLSQEQFSAERAKDLQFEEPKMRFWKRISARCEDEAFRALAPASAH